MKGDGSGLLLELGVSVGLSLGLVYCLDRIAAAVSFGNGGATGSTKVADGLASIGAAARRLLAALLPDDETRAETRRLGATSTAGAPSDGSATGTAGTGTIGGAGTCNPAIIRRISEAVGNTPLIELRELSALLGVRVLGKCEFMNPGGSVKDRVAVHMLEAAIGRESDGHSTARARKTGRYPGGIFEGTSGSTGISLALLAHEFGTKCTIYLPDDIGAEKVRMLRAAGAQLHLCPTVGFSDPKHYCQQAKRASEAEGGYYCDQFDNPLNWQAHFGGTGPEIWEQLKPLLPVLSQGGGSGRRFAFVAGSGTGGTVCGVGRYLKEKSPQALVYMSDPPGSSLARYVGNGICFNDKDKEGFRTRRVFDTIVEGIGLNRVTKNLKTARNRFKVLDGVFPVTDQEAVHMAHFLLYREGIFCGSSSGVNLAACVKLARTLPQGSVIVTILCDRGDRHLSKFWSPVYLKEQSLLPEEYYDVETLQVDRERLSQMDWLGAVK